MTEQIKVAICNRKGGVGKTSLTLGLASAFAVLKKRTLVVDLDSQANASFNLLHGDILNKLGTAEFLKGGEVELQTVNENLQVMTASPDLAEANIMKLDPEELNFRLRAFEHEIVLMDCPPNGETIDRMALVACTHLVIPVDAHPFSLLGARRIVEELVMRQERGQPVPRSTLLVRSKIDRRRALDRDLEETLSSIGAFQDLTQLEVVQDSELAATTSSFELLLETSPSARSAKCMTQIRDWILEN